MPPMHITLVSLSYLSNTPSTPHDKQTYMNRGDRFGGGFYASVVFRSSTWMPTRQGHMEGTGWAVLLLRGANKETVNHHCDDQTRLGSHGWVRGVMEVIRIRCGFIISFINKMTDASELIPKGKMCSSIFSVHALT